MNETIMNYPGLFILEVLKNKLETQPGCVIRCLWRESRYFYLVYLEKLVKPMYTKEWHDCIVLYVPRESLSRHLRIGISSNTDLKLDVLLLLWTYSVLLKP